MLDALEELLLDELLEVVSFSRDSLSATALEASTVIDGSTEAADFCR